MNSLYKSIIEDEMKFFNIEKDSLKTAAKKIQKSYGQAALQNGTTFIDFNVPSNRCAYLYKFANIHTCLDYKYFLKMISKKQVKSILKKKQNFKVCCLGGGPGTDLVGLFKAMAVYPHYHKKVIEVTILDICGGWRNSFNRVMAKLSSGQVKNFPSTFLDKDNFKYQVVEVDLLKTLQDNIISILSGADIVCMVKFVSAILGKPSFMPAIQSIGSYFKMDAVVLFIDNFNGKVFQPLTEIAEHVGLQVVVGPLHDDFGPKTGYQTKPVTAAEKEMFGGLPLCQTKVSALALIKNKILVSDFEKAPNMIANVNKPVEEKDKHLDTKESNCLVDKHVKERSCDKSTQTSCSPVEDFEGESYILNKLGLLFNSLSDLINVLNQWRQKQVIQNQCNCHCHCHS